MLDTERDTTQTIETPTIETPTIETPTIETLAAQMGHLQEALAEQQEAFLRQQDIVTQQEHLIAQQQAELGTLRARMDTADVAPPTQDVGTTEGARPARDGIGRRAARKRSATTSRRKLLTGAGAAAAAATVALVASEQHAAHAASAIDGNIFQLGSGANANNTASTTTTLSAVAGSTPSALLTVDASNSLYSASFTGPTAIRGIVGPFGAGAAYAIGVQGTSTNGYGVYGSCASGFGVYGWGAIGVRGSADGNDGVSGISNSGNGVHGVSTSWYGVRAESTSGWGMYATSSDWGVVGSSGAKADLVAYGTGRILQTVQGTAGAPTSGTFSAGESIRDKNGELWLCVAGDGSDVGTWVKVAHLAPGATLGGATTYLAKPTRLLDTRSGESDALNHGGGPLTNQQPNPSYTLQVSGVTYNPVTVPASAVGAIGNVTVVASSDGPGYVSLVPQGAGFSGTSNINYVANQTIANSFNVGLSPDGKLDIYVGGAATDVIIDIFAVIA